MFLVAFSSCSPRVSTCSSLCWCSRDSFSLLSSSSPLHLKARLVRAFSQSSVKSRVGGVSVCVPEGKVPGSSSSVHMSSPNTFLILSLLCSFCLLGLLQGLQAQNLLTQLPQSQAHILQPQPSIPLTTQVNSKFINVLISRPLLCSAFL